MTGLAVNLGRSVLCTAALMLLATGCGASRTAAPPAPSSAPAATQPASSPPASPPAAGQPAVAAGGDTRACSAFQRVQQVLGTDNSANAAAPGSGNDSGDGSVTGKNNGTRTAAWLVQQAADADSQLRQAVDHYASAATAGVSGKQLSQDAGAIAQQCD